MTDIRVSALVAAAVVAIASTQVAAQKPCDPKAKPTACFVESANTSLFFCQNISNAKMEVARLKQERPDFACIDTGFAKIEPLYAKAVRASKSKAQTDMLKDFYGSWRSAMNGVRPDIDELAIGYKMRQTKSRAALDEKAERLKLE